MPFEGVYIKIEDDANGEERGGGACGRKRLAGSLLLLLSH